MSGPDPKTCSGSAKAKSSGSGSTPLHYYNFFPSPIYRSAGSLSTPARTTSGTSSRRRTGSSWLSSRSSSKSCDSLMAGLARPSPWLFELRRQVQSPFGVFLPGPLLDSWRVGLGSFFVNKKRKVNILSATAESLSMSGKTIN
jgi:hypothetical protein